jgi:endo-1,4-beta-mannosidase
MNLILFNEKEFDFTDDNFPVLINGEDKSGASLYTITLSANLFSQHLKILYLCGYQHAEEEFKRQVGGDFDKNYAVFYTKEQISEFKRFLGNLGAEERVIILKNIELFGEDIFDLISGRNKLIISGDINKCNFKNKILNKKFNTKIFFSPLDVVIPSMLKKYDAFFVWDGLKGITKVRLN